jgi:hypothetical protein
MVDFSKPNKKRNPIHDLFDNGSKNTNQVFKPVIHTTKKSDFYEEQMKGLNDEQAVMVNKMSKYIENPFDKPYFMVQGGGGTGKSFSVVRALNGIYADQIIAAAPSHFAKNVLQDFLGNKYSVCTIAALLGKKVTFDDTGKQILTRINFKFPPPITNFKIIILDEGSMIDDETATEIIDYAKRSNKALIILGDYCQLPPVNQDTDSLFFNNISAELTIPMRFTGPIYDLSLLLRKEIIKIRNGIVPSLNIINITTDRVSNIREDGSGYIFLNSLNIVLNAAIKRFKKNKGTKYVRILAYRNKTIDKLNNRIRLGLYGEYSAQYEVGELVINNGGYTLKKAGSQKNPVIISNGSLFNVKSAKAILGPFNIPCIKLKFIDQRFEGDIITVANEGKNMYTAKLSELTSMAKRESKYWKDVFAFKESFAYFNYSYAASIHKAQGSTINHVFILEDDVFAVKLTSTKQKLQSMYVAISRAGFRAYIYNKDFKVQNKFLNREYLKIDVDEGKVR